jgi:hypothetical protein
MLVKSELQQQLEHMAQAAAADTMAAAKQTASAVVAVENSVAAMARRQLAELQDTNKALEQKLFATAERIDRCEQNAATLADKEETESAAAALAAAMEADLVNGLDGAAMSADAGLAELRRLVRTELEQAAAATTTAQNALGAASYRDRDENRAAIADMQRELTGAHSQLELKLAEATDALYGGLKMEKEARQAAAEQQTEETGNLRDLLLARSDKLKGAILDEAADRHSGQDWLKHMCAAGIECMFRG